MADCSIWLYNHLMRTIIATDLHGCDQEFRELLQKVYFNPTRDRLILLGDLFDRGDESWEVFQHVKQLKKMLGGRMILIRGNHDQLLLNTLDNRDNLRLWAFNGGLTTVNSFQSHDDDIESARELLESTPLFFETEDYICVHAGLKSEIPGENDPEILLWDRDVICGSYRGKLGIGGHTPLRNPVWFVPDGRALLLKEDTHLPLPDKGFICLDTGCVFGGRLTCMVIEDEEFYVTSVRRREGREGLMSQ